MMMIFVALMRLASRIDDAANVIWTRERSDFRRTSKKVQGRDSFDDDVRSSHILAAKANPQMETEMKLLIP